MEGKTKGLKEVWIGRKIGGWTEGKNKVFF
jgi:hypothetical protein